MLLIIRGINKHPFLYITTKFFLITPLKKGMCIILMFRRTHFNIHICIRHRKSRYNNLCPGLNWSSSLAAPIEGGELSLSLSLSVSLSVERQPGIWHRMLIVVIMFEMIMLKLIKI